MDDTRKAEPIVSDQPTTESTEPVETTVVDPMSPEERNELIPQENWATSPMFYEIANFLGVESREYDSSAEKISVITDWAIQKSGSNKVEDIMHTIRELEGKLQPASWGERRVSHVYQFLRMEARYDAARRALGAFTKTGKWN